MVLLYTNIITLQTRPIEKRIAATDIYIDIDIDIYTVKPLSLHTPEIRTL